MTHWWSSTKRWAARISTLFNWTYFKTYLPDLHIMDGTPLNFLERDLVRTVDLILGIPPLEAVNK
jgi:hypothetical protein